MQGAARAAVGQALDAPVDRVGGVCGDAREREGGRVRPGAVVVAVVEEHGPDPLDGVERGGGRRATGERAHRPAAPGDPGAGGVRGVGPRQIHGRVTRDDPAVVVGRRPPAEIAAEPFEPALDGVDVRVDEAGVQHPARKIVHDGRRAAPVSEVGADRGDPAVDDGDLECVRTGRRRPGRSVRPDRSPRADRPRSSTTARNNTAARPRVDDSAGEEEVCVGHGPRAGGGERAQAPGIQMTGQAEVLALTS